MCARYFGKSACTDPATRAVPFLEGVALVCERHSEIFGGVERIVDLDLIVTTKTVVDEVVSLVKP